MEKIFEFVDSLDNEDVKCITKIVIEDRISNNSPIYDIKYTHTIVTPEKSFTINNPKEVVKPCPFAYYLEGDQVVWNYDGAIVIKNPLTTKMVEFLMMDDLELVNHTGCTTPQHYRKLIMVNITHFWD